MKNHPNFLVSPFLETLLIKDYCSHLWLVCSGTNSFLHLHRKTMWRSSSSVIWRYCQKMVGFYYRSHTFKILGIWRLTESQLYNYLIFHWAPPSLQKMELLKESFRIPLLLLWTCISIVINHIFSWMYVVHCFVFVLHQEWMQVHSGSKHGVCDHIT